MFYPCPSVRMPIDLVYLKSPQLPFESTCPECAQLFRQSGALDLVTSVAWRDLLKFNLATLVSFQYNIIYTPHHRYSLKQNNNTPI